MLVPRVRGRICLAAQGQTSVFCSDKLLVHWEAQMSANELVDSINCTNNQLTQFTFSRNDKPIAFTEHKVDLTFKDPRGNGEILRILLDPQYRPGDASNADFWVQTTITSPISNKE